MAEQYFVEQHADYIGGTQMSDKLKYKNFKYFGEFFSQYFTTKTLPSAQSSWVHFKHDIVQGFLHIFRGIVQTGIVLLFRIFSAKFSRNNVL